MINEARRKILKMSGGIAALVAGGGIALAGESTSALQASTIAANPSTPPGFDTAMEGIREYYRQQDRARANFMHCRSEPTAFHDLGVKLNEAIMLRYPDLFNFGNFVKAAETKDRGVITRSFDARFQFAAIDSSKAPSIYESPDHISGIVDKIAAEIRGLPPVRQIAWYVPIVTTGLMVDPYSFEPVMRFASRFAVEKPKLV